MSVPSPCRAMRVGYSRSVAVGFLLLGAAVIIVNVMASAGGVNAMRCIPGGICLAVGLAYLTRPYFMVEGAALVVPAPLGTQHRTYPFDAERPVRVRDGAVFVGTRKVGMRRWLAHKSHWTQFEAWIATEQVSSVFD